MQYRPFRHPTEYPASLDSPISGMKISVLDVNETGAMLRTDSPLTTGTKIAFSFMHYTAAGTVMWASGQHCGNAFSPNISLAEASVLRYERTHNTGRVHHMAGISEMY